MPQKLCEKFLRIGMDWLLHVWMEFSKFSLVNIHNCLMRPARQVLRCVSSNREIQSYTNGQ